MLAPFLNISFPDIVDILVVAVLLYTATAFLKQTRAAFIIRGIFILAAIYILARYLDLQLTAWLFQGFFAIFLIIIVVIFQEELRQIFERGLEPRAEWRATAGLDYQRYSGRHGRRSGQG
jgi:diadenylate cyclase